MGNNRLLIKSKYQYYLLGILSPIFIIMTIWFVNSIKIDAHKCFKIMAKCFSLILIIVVGLGILLDFFMGPQYSSEMYLAVVSTPGTVGHYLVFTPLSVYLIKLQEQEERKEDFLLDLKKDKNDWVWYYRDGFSHLCSFDCF